MTALSLPYPPSANRLWRAHQGRNIKSATYRNWLDAAHRSIRSQRPQPVAGRYRLTVIVRRPDNRARDLDNLMKPVCDALAQAGVVENDSKADRITIEWDQAAPIPGGYVCAIIEPVTLIGNLGADTAVAALEAIDGLRGAA